MIPFKPCQASRGHSINFTSDINKSLPPICADSQRSELQETKTRFANRIDSVRIRGEKIKLRLQHSYLELRNVRVQRRRFQCLGYRFACLDRIDDLVDPQPCRPVARIGLLII